MAVVFFYIARDEEAFTCGVGLKDMDEIGAVRKRGLRDKDENYKIRKIEKTGEVRIMKMDKKIQRAIIPNYYEAFQCIGGACDDTCCASWLLPIDEETYKKYKKVKHPEMKRRLDKELVCKKGSTDPEYAAKIKLKNNRCAFLAKDNWCDIHSQLGEKYLSHSCTQYPRTINQVQQALEYSLTASCPEAARKILLNPEGIIFKEAAAKAEMGTISAKVTQGEFLKVRKDVIETLQNRKLSLEDRLAKLYEKYTGSKASGFYDTKQMQELLETIQDLLEGKKLHSSRYETCLSAVVEELGSLKQPKHFGAVYEEALKFYYEPFLKEKGYMLENYLVHYTFERCMPLDCENVGMSIKRMFLYYHLVKLHLIGMAIKEKELNEQMVVLLIQSFTKVYDHGQGYIEKILTTL